MLENESDLGRTLTEPETTASLEGETLANGDWRSTKAQQQLRDRFGRWISLGANVRFRADGQELAGTVTQVLNGKAYVDTKNPDGTLTHRVLDPGAIRVLASKATIPDMATPIHDQGNNFLAAMQTPAVKNALASTGQANILRADGYMLSMTEKRPKDTGNPYLYQLFAPGGRSLGKYSTGAEGDFDSMVLEDAAASGSPSAGPAAAGPSGGGDAGGGGVVASGEERPFRVPEAVRAEIQSTISSLSTDLDEAELAVASRLANDPTVSKSDVEWVHQFFSFNDVAERIRGGYQGRKWASKIITPSDDELYAPDDCLDPHPKYDFDDDTFAYFAIGDEIYSPTAVRLLSVDYETGAVYVWGPDGFVLIPELDMGEIDEPQITPVDEITAIEIAKALDDGAEGVVILDINPEERNLFSMAESEIDFDQLDQTFAVIADATGYTPAERSANARRQRRAPGGKFGDAPDPQATLPTGDAPEKKATLPTPLPLVENVKDSIDKFISTAKEAPIAAAGTPPVPADTPATSATDSGESPADQQIEDNNTSPTDEAIYFAIVDPVDKSAVLDAVAIVKQNNAPSAWKRANGTWADAPDTMVALQGPTPPPVVELAAPDPLKPVLQQIDDHDAGKDDTPAAEKPAPGEVPIAASGYSLADGSYRIIDAEDLQNAVVASAATTDIFVKAHVRKRARVLNRMDLIPAEWRELSLAEIGELSAAQTLYGEFGEILPVTAGGVPGSADTPGDMKAAMKLKSYWTHGKGAAKIRWGTKGDLTRAHRHLSKYVGPERAWGLAQNYHQYLFGVYNYTHDVATGQYAPRNRKK